MCPPSDCDKESEEPAPETEAQAIVYARRLAVEAKDADTMTCTEGEPVFYFE